MKPIVTAKQMSEIDAYCIDQLKIPGVVLMENAGIGVVNQALVLLKNNPAGKQVLILCGPGNNGGDGFVAARHLINQGAQVYTLVLSPREKIKDDALVNLEILEKMDHLVRFLDTFVQPIVKPDLIIDAMLGTGVKGALRGIFIEYVEWANQQPCKTLAVDIPTGVNGDDGSINGPVIKADITATMALPKPGLLFSPGREFAGKIETIDISMPQKAFDNNISKVWMPEPEEIKGLLPSRPLDAYKNKFGTVAVVAGSRGFTGAACLSSMAVLKSGSGLSYLCAPASLNVIYESQMAEVITWPFDNDKGYLSIKDIDKIKEKINEQSVVALGPGLGQAQETSELVLQLLKDLDKSMVLDADGLNICANHPESIINYRGEMVLTPHPGEFSRLTGLSIKEIQSDRIEWVRKYSKKWNQVLVLKGGPTLVGTPEGDVYINPTGNAGMATAGSGDVLTGIIAGFISQGLGTYKAALAGVYIHGLAGDLAKDDMGEAGMTAMDILNNLPRAMEKVKNG